MRVRDILLGGAALATIASSAWAADAPTTDTEPKVSEVVVTASTVNLIGKAATSSQGAVTREEIDLRPVYRVGQLLETVPGLVATAHSGEGKANQYLLRGFNLDHGTDLATFVDGMPVNMRTHAHGQGYTDLNFMIPELASGINYTKGPYFPAEGDFSTVGSVAIGYSNFIQDQITVSAGTVGDQRLFAAGTTDVGDGRLLAAGEAVHLDGPWVHPDNMRKFNGVLRYSKGEAAEGFSITLMGYHAQWNATTDQPLRAITQGLIGRFGSLDPSDGGQASRFSASARWTHGTLDWRFAANAYAIRSELTLWNDFTHFLDDPVNGDQHAQDDRRWILGGAAGVTRYGKIGAVASETTLGLQVRYDDAYVDLQHTRQRAALATLIADNVQEISLGAYVSNTTYWTDWLRSIIGAREDYFHGADQNLVGGLTGSEGKALFQPKGSLVFGPFADTELYLSAGEGFHSNDVRAGNAANVGATVPVRPIFLVKSQGEEIGIRTGVIPHVLAQLTVFQIDFDSELTYDADVGQTSAGPPSRRRGVEISAQYRPFRWIELNADIAATRARYLGVQPGGNYIPDAPSIIISAGMLVDNLGPWFGGVEFRDLGSHPLVQDNSVRSSGYREVNLNIGYKLTPKLKVRMDVYNLTDSGDDAADYFYTDRLPGEPAAGVDDLHIHPLEPRSFRFTLTKTF